jgi:hypothetical protein
MPNLVRAIEEQERLASNAGSLAEERQKALDLYLGRPYGDEQDGRSKVVMRDVADTIEWIKPSLMKVFCSGDEIARFDPIGPEDEQQAQQETDYINHVLMTKNDGFAIFYDWFHDALLQKNGYVLVRNCEERTTNRDQYKGLADDEFTLLAKDPDVEVLEHTEYQAPAGVDQMGMPVMATYHDAVIRKAGTYRYLKISNIPPERVRIAPDWPSLNLKGCPFFEIEDYKTISDLRNEGYDVDDDINDTATTTEEESTAQRRNVTSGYQQPSELEADPATRRVKVRYVWMLWDGDGDGIAELRHVVLCGKTILQDEEDDLTPAACLCPIRMPHEHNGQSIADIVEDLQRIRTVLVRGYLDNMYLANNGQYAIDINRVNLDDMLTSRPGGVKRVDGDLTGAIMPLVHPQVGSDILQAVEYVDTVRENRTGVTRYNQGMDADSLNKTATGINLISNAAAQRIELIARLFAETGVKALMLIVHALSLKYGREQEMVKLRGQWVPVSPATWKTRRDMTVSVGLGNGNKDQMLQHLMMIAQMQAQGAAIGIATPLNIYNTAKRFTQNAGFKNADEFWTDPQKNPQPQQPNPEMMKLEMEAKSKEHDAQLKQQQAQADIQFKQQDAQIELEKAQVELQIKLAELELKKQELELKAQAAQVDQQIAVQKTHHEMQRDEAQLGMQERQHQVDAAMKAEQQKEANKPDPRIDEMHSMLSDMIGSQAVGFERDENGRIAGIKRRNGSVTQVQRDEKGRISNLH